jgi:hypothetical protein
VTTPVAAGPSGDGYRCRTSVVDAPAARASSAQTTRDEAEARMGSDQDPVRPEPNGGDTDAGDAHQYVDRSKIDFDPEDGLYTGTAVEGTSEIPGPHEQGDATETDSGSGSEDQPDDT